MYRLNQKSSTQGKIKASQGYKKFRIGVAKRLSRLKTATCKKFREKASLQQNKGSRRNAKSSQLTKNSKRQEKRGSRVTRFKTKDKSTLEPPLEPDPKIRAKLKPLPLTKVKLRYEKIAY